MSVAGPSWSTAQGLSLCFESPLALIFILIHVYCNYPVTLVVNIASPTVKFNCNIKGPSSILSHNKELPVRAFDDSLRTGSNMYLSFYSHSMKWLEILLSAVHNANIKIIKLKCIKVTVVCIHNKYYQ